MLSLRRWMIWCLTKETTMSDEIAEDVNMPYRLAESSAGCLICGTRPATHRFSVLPGPDGWLCEEHKDDPVTIGGQTYGSTQRRYDESE